MKYLNYGKLIVLFSLITMPLFAEVHVIEFGGVHGDNYVPNNLTVNVGDTVEWQGAFEFHPLSSTDIPSGADAFQESDGNSFMYVVNTPGEYDYRCDFHYLAGMVGSFTAVEDVPTESQSFIAVLLGENETPPVETEGTGGGMFILNAAQDSLWFYVRVCNLTDSIIGAHFHNAPAGEPGGVVKAITQNFVGEYATGVWTATDEQPLTEELVAELLAGNIYVNVHTPTYPSGEIRGQLTFDQPVTLVANLSGDQEVPPNGEVGTGEGTFALAGDGSSLDYEVTVQNLTGGIKAAHFHREAIGVAGPVVKPIEFSGLTSTGTWSNTDADAPLTPELVADILGCYIYVNIHTSCYPAGEIRGQLLLDDNDGGGQVPTSVSESSAPVKYELAQNYPNPFNPVTVIKYAIPEAVHVKLQIYNSLGEIITTLVDENKEAGVYQANFNALGLSSGVYIYKIEAGSYSSSNKMIIMK